MSLSFNSAPQNTLKFCILFNLKIVKTLALKTYYPFSEEIRGLFTKKNIYSLKFHILTKLKIVKTLALN